MAPTFYLHLSESALCRHSSNTPDDADSKNKVRHSSKTNNNKVMLDQQVAR